MITFGYDSSIVLSLHNLIYFLTFIRFEQKLYLEASKDSLAEFHPTLWLSSLRASLVKMWPLQSGCCMSCWFHFLLVQLDLDEDWRENKGKQSVTQSPCVIWEKKCSQWDLQDWTPKVCTHMCKYWIHVSNNTLFLKCKMWNINFFICLCNVSWLMQ